MAALTFSRLLITDEHKQEPSGTWDSTLHASPNHQRPSALQHQGRCGWLREHQVAGCREEGMWFHRNQTLRWRSWEGVVSFKTKMCTLKQLYTLHLKREGPETLGQQHLSPKENKVLVSPWSSKRLSPNPATASWHSFRERYHSWPKGHIQEDSQGCHL